MAEGSTENAEIDFNAIDPEAQYEVTLVSAIKMRNRLITPSADRVQLKGKVILENKDAIGAIQR